MAMKLVNFRVWEDDWERWHAEAKTRRTSVSELIRDAVNAEVALPRAAMERVGRLMTEIQVPPRVAEGACRHGLSTCSVCGVGVATGR